MPVIQASVSNAPVVQLQNNSYWDRWITNLGNIGQLGASVMNAMNTQRQSQAFQWQIQEAAMQRALTLPTDQGVALLKAAGVPTDRIAYYQSLQGKRTQDIQQPGYMATARQNAAAMLRDEQLALSGQQPATQTPAAPAAPTAVAHESQHMPPGAFSFGETPTWGSPSTPAQPMQAMPSPVSNDVQGTSNLIAQLIGPRLFGGGMGGMF